MAAPIQLTFDLGLEDLNPVAAGSSVSLPDRTAAPYADCVFLCHIRSGSGSVHSRGKSYRANRNQAFILLPGEEVSVHSNADTPLDYVWVGFNGKLAPHFSVLSPVFSLPKGSFSNLHDPSLSADAIGFLLTGDLLTVYVKLLQPQYQERDYIQLIIEHMEKNYMQKLKIENFALRFNMDRRYLNQQFKAKTGISVRAYLTQVRVIKAGELLLKGHSTAETAALCGFGNASNFHKMFTDHYGMTPLEWKQSHRAE